MEKTNSYRSCYDEKCQIELGRELAAQKVISSKILKVGSRCNVTSTLYDLRKAASELGAEEGSDCNENALLQAVKSIARKLCEKLGSTTIQKAEEIEKRKEKLELAWKKARDIARTGVYLSSGGQSW